MGAFIQELMHVGIYKRSQGRITRQITFAAVAIAFTLGLWRMSLELKTADWTAGIAGIQFWLPGGLLFAGLWIAYRMVNVPSFADFLIAVEAEMNKVSWPTRSELFRASMVVLITIFVLATVLYGFDIVWKFVFTKVLRIY